MTEDAIGKCIDCGGEASQHRNCEYTHCHGKIMKWKEAGLCSERVDFSQDLNLQCDACAKKKLGCCSIECMEMLLGTKEQRKKLDKRMHS